MEELGKGRSKGVGLSAKLPKVLSRHAEAQRYFSPSEISSTLYLPRASGCYFSEMAKFTTALPLSVTVTLFSQLLASEKTGRCTFRSVRTS
jgi:hypothetical protein